MNGEFSISIPRLRESFERVIDYLVQTEGSSLALSRDYFWSISADELYNVYSRPTDMTIGQLTESWQHLEDLLDGQTDVLRYHLVWLADVLRAIGQDGGR